jgi:dTMP kinase
MSAQTADAIAVQPPGLFIALEGGEGAGKSTHAQKLCGWLRGRGREVVLTREPGGSPLAEAIRAIVLGNWDEGIDATTEALLMFAARAAHVHAVIAPALAQRKVVICDRFVDASFAYQGAARGLGTARIAQLEQLTLNGLRPDLVLLLDLDPAIGLARAHSRGGANRFEAETARFMALVREAYLERARAAPERYAVIDASRSPEEVGAAIQTAVDSVLERSR